MRERVGGRGRKEGGKKEGREGGGERGEEVLGGTEKGLHVHVHACISEEQAAIVSSLRFIENSCTSSPTTRN